MVDKKGAIYLKSAIRNMFDGISTEEAANKINSFMEYYNKGGLDYD